MRSIAVLAVASAALLVGCVTPPRGPQIGAMPGPNKSFEEFQRDQYECENYAGSQVAGDADAANRSAVGAAAIGTALGAAVGAATGRGRNVGTGAAIGAVAGTAVGSNISAHAQYDLQRRYDIAYAQCMSAKGNRVPGFSSPPTSRYGAPPPPPYRGY